MTIWWFFSSAAERAGDYIRSFSGLEMHTASAHYRRETEVWRRGRKSSMQLHRFHHPQRSGLEQICFKVRMKADVPRTEAGPENETKRSITWKTVQIRPLQTNTQSERQWPLQPERTLTISTAWLSNDVSKRPWRAGISSISHSHQRGFRYAVFQIHAWMNDEFKIFL